MGVLRGRRGGRRWRWRGFGGIGSAEAEFEGFLAFVVDQAHGIFLEIAEEVARPAGCETGFSHGSNLAGRLSLILL